MTGMVEIARPAFLWAGLLLAGVPLLLHLLRPRERKPRLLPTTRFLTPETKTRMRMHKIPDRLLLLALRMGLCLILGAALAGMSWVGPSQGTVQIVVAAVPPAGSPDSLPVEEHLARLQEMEAAQIVRVPADPGASFHLAHLLRALRDEAGHSTGVDSLSARVVARPGWEAWGPGTLELRDHLWPGRISLEVPSSPSPGAEDDPLPATPISLAIHLDADRGLRTPITEALELLGLPVHHEPGSAPEGAAASIDPPSIDSPEDPSADVPPPIHLRVGEGVRLGDLWTLEEPSSGQGDTYAPGEGTPGHHFLLLDGRVIQGAGTFPAGIPGADTKVPLLRVGGTPTAAARFRPEPGSDSRPDDGGESPPGSGAGCTVALPLAEDAPVLGSGELPLLLDALLREGCPGVLVQAPEPVPEDGAEEAWRLLLEEGQRPERVEAAPLRYEGAGFSLSRLLLALAVAVALGEMALTRRLEGPAQGRRP